MIKLTITLLSLCWLAAGCASYPSANFDRSAEAIGFQRSEMTTNLFDLAVYTGNDLLSDTLHIYIGGDGSPWHTPTVVKFDPTQVRPLILDLMEIDTAKTVLLGRPCYHHAGRGRNCDSKWWTSHRYAAEVVDAMASVIQELISGADYRSVTLIGFSGGGTLAWLLSRELENIDTLVTLSGNLDIDHWTQQHNYTPLYGSQNPATYLRQEESLHHDMLQLHLTGQDDLNIDAAHINRLVSGQPATVSRVIPGFTHRCCWPTIWRDVLTVIEQSHSSGNLEKKLDQILPAAAQ